MKNRVQALAHRPLEQSRGSAGIYPGRVGVGFGLGPAAPGEESSRGRPQAGNEHHPQIIANAEENNEQQRQKGSFPGTMDR